MSWEYSGFEGRVSGALGDFEVSGGGSLGVVRGRPAKASGAESLDMRDSKVE
jgi:hypothetical protein